MKIVALDSYALNPGDLDWEQLKKLGEIEIYQSTSEAEIIKRAEGADILLINKTPLKSKTIESLKNLKYIGVLSTGYNIVDLEAARANDIIVTNIPDYGTDSVAQFVFALLLEVTQQVGYHNEQVKKGAWTEKKYLGFWNHSLIELKHKTMGIIGFGSIGQKTAEIALSFGMKVIAYDLSPEKKIDDPEIETEKIEFLSLNELYARADIISLHCPLTDLTRGIIDHKAFEQMQKGVIIINTARGPLIVESDLKEALASGKVKTAALDVMSTEPPAASNELLQSEKTIITPHIAWATEEARKRLMDIAFSNLKSFMAGKVINQVN